MTNYFVEQEVLVSSKFNLAATVSIPENRGMKMPAVVLISGSGNLDRDGNERKFKTNLYKDLSDFFAMRGFITIRFDKRGIGGSEGDFYESGFHDFVDDVIASVNYLEDHNFVDKEKIILCGHSEGSMIATIASTRKSLAGMILLAGAGTSLRSALNYQNWLLLQETKTMTGWKGWMYRKLINEKNYLKNVNTLFEKCRKTDKDVIRVMGTKMSAKWIREHSELSDEKMISVIAKANCPILTVTGEKDVQATPDDITKIEQLKLSHVNCNIIAEMDHMLRRYRDELTILNIKKQYASEFSQPIHEDLLNVIKEWTKKIGLNPM